MFLYQLLALCAVAVADIARSVWVMIAVLDASRGMPASPWLAIVLVMATGGLSLALLGLVMRAMLERRALAPPPREAPLS